MTMNLGPSTPPGGATASNKLLQLTFESPLGSATPSPPAELTGAEIRRYGLSVSVCIAIFLSLFAVPGFAKDEPPQYSCKLLHPRSQCADIVNDPLDKIVECAESGDMEAQNILSQMYYAGSSEVRASLKKAVRYTRMSAEQGCPEAQRLMGHFYYNGLGVAPSQSEAAGWWEMAAAKKEPYAMCQLGLMHFRGDHPRQDYTVGFQLVSEAYKLYDFCGVNLAVAYYNGFGTEPSVQKAIAVLQSELSRGNEQVRHFLEKLLSEAQEP